MAAQQTNSRNAICTDALRLSFLPGQTHVLTRKLHECKQLLAMQSACYQACRMLLDMLLSLHACHILTDKEAWSLHAAVDTEMAADKMADDTENLATTDVRNFADLPVIDAGDHADTHEGNSSDGIIVFSDVAAAPLD